MKYTYQNERLVGLKLILLISETGSNAGQVIKAYLPRDFILLEGGADDRGGQMLKNIAPGIVLVDTTATGALSWLDEVYQFRTDLTYLAITDKRETADLPSLFYDFLSPPFEPLQVQNLFQRAWERVVFLMQKNTGTAAGKTIINHDQNNSMNGSYNHKEHTLGKFSRALGNEFNRGHLIDLFLNTLVELVPVSKISLLLSNGKDGVYQIAAQRGLDPQITPRLIFKANEGLMAWLAKEGRILFADGFGTSPDLLLNEALQEIKMLHSLISIPLTARGSLVGALNLGPKITGCQYNADELEILYMLSGNVATALLDIELHHQLRLQKLYIENILLRMNSGVIAIDMHDRITTFNERAAKILQMNQHEVIYKDLRCLPSPLGDLLFRTRSSGESYDRMELELPLNRLPLEVSTYQLVGDGVHMLGSVMIFENITERRQLEEERRKTDQLDVLNRFVGHLAHEIKNPMVAILTFAELLSKKYDDQSFREDFANVVQKEIKRLNELVEQLIDYSTPLAYKYGVEDIHTIVEQGLSIIQAQDSKNGARIEYIRQESMPVKADRAHLAKAFAYLIYCFLHNLSPGSTLTIQVELSPSLYAEGGVRLSFWSPGARPDKEYVAKIFDPLYFQQDQRISLGLPVSRKIVEDHGGRMNASLSREGYLKIDVELPISKGKG